MPRPAAHWRPGASLAALRLAADVRRRMRSYLDGQGVLEVATPVASLVATSDPAIESLVTAATPTDSPLWLQSSPESACKRLLAAYGHDVWQLGPVFRANERGRRHAVEFNLLEWYRTGFDLDAMMADVEALVRAVADGHEATRAPFERLSHGELVRDVAGEWPEALGVTEIAALFRARGASWPDGMRDDEPDAAVDLLFDEFVLPRLPTGRMVFVTGWPAGRASLARLCTDAHGRTVAARFELYAGALELANGYHELSDAAEQRRRFEADLGLRERRGRPAVPLDERLLAALEAGLPDCAGVALGLERLLMVLAGTDDIDAVMAFAGDRA